MKRAALCALPVAAVTCILFSSCGSTQNAAAAQPVPVELPEPESESLPHEDEAVAIALPPKKNLTYFSLIDESVVADVEKGSPESLRNAISALRRNSASYSENEKVLLSVAASMMQITWPEEVFAVEVPAVTAVTPYLGAIESARQGVYDSSTGNVDFLTLALPSLVLLTSQTRNDYYAESESALTKALEKQPDSVFALYLQGTLYMRQLRYVDAVSSFEHASRLSPSCYECMYAYAQAALKAGKIAEAKERAEALLQKNPLRISLLGLCAEASFAAGDLAAAEQYVARVLQQQPDNAAYVLFRAKILVAKNDFIKAASLLDVYARTDSTSRDYLVLRSRVQKEWNRNISAATKTIEQALTLYPDDEEIILAAASLASESGVTIAGTTAESLASRVLAVDGNNVQARRIQVSSFVQQKKWSEAYRASSELLKLDREQSLSLHIDICLESGHADEAWNLASTLYAQKPQDESVQQTYLKVLVSTKRSQEASRLITQLLTSATTRMKSFLYYERSYLSSNEDAIFADLRASLTANPRNKDALFRLYSIYYNKKDWRKAQYYLKQVVALSPTDASLLALNRELDALLSR